MTHIITKAWVNELREIPEMRATIAPDMLEYRFRMSFRGANDVQGFPKRVSLFLDHVGPGQKPQIEVAIVKPYDANEVKLQKKGNERRRAAGVRGGDAGGATPKAKSDTGAVQFMRARRPVFPKLPRDFEDIVGGGSDVLDRPSITVDEYEYFVRDNDPDGEWKLRIKNLGSEPHLFRVVIYHAGTQIRLTESRVPLSLLNRVLQKINRLVGLNVKIDREASIDFRPEFKRLTGLERKTYAIGAFEIPRFGNALYLKDINLENIDVSIARLSGTSIGLLAQVGFETEGPEEIDINNWDDIDVHDLAGKATLEFSGRRDYVYSEQYDLGGNVLSSHAPAGQVSLTLDADVHTDAWQAEIREVVRDKLSGFLSKKDTKDALNVIAEHATDVFMFLAVGSEARVFYDLQVTDSDIVVRHYPKPSDLRPELPIDLVKVRDFQRADMLLVDDDQPDSDHPVSGELVPPPGRFADSGEMLRIAMKKSAAGPRQIEHIVVLMLENRSFDHMLGYLTLLQGRTDVDGLTAPSAHTNPVPGSTREQGIYQLDDGGIVRIDPGHGVMDVTQQVASGAMNGFVSNYMSKDSVRNRPGEEKLVMGYYADDLLSTFNTLAREYLVCDRWFCSHPGPTQPNRFASLMGATPSIDNLYIDSGLMGSIKADTVFDLLTEAGVSWKYVESNIAFLRFWDKYRVDEKNIVQIDDWLQLARAGKLPAASWIDPNYGDIDIDELANDDHPPSNIVMGQRLVQDIYGALTAVHQQWQKTLFLITYDEHGGFYDHVPPYGLGKEKGPMVHKIHPDGGEYYGLRVPTFVVTPWVGRGTVSSTVFDHTSLLKTILLNFLGPEAVEQGLLGQRTDAANDLLQLLTPSPRADSPSLPQHPVIPPTSELSPPIERDSFHLGIRMFGFGSRLRRTVAGRIDE